MLNIKETTKYGKLDPEFKEKWVVALRSNSYQQALGCLRNEKGFCCLGVACEIVDPLQWDKNLDGNYLWGKSRALLPLDVQASIGLSNEAMQALMTLNDVLRNNFSEIADWIEENL